MRIADLILPVVAVIATGWLVGCTGYLSRTLSAALIHFAYNIAMPALLIVTIAQQPGHSLINWRFLVAFGSAPLLPAAIATVFVAVVMFPTTVILLELDQRDARGSRAASMATLKHIVLNPLVISTLIGILWSVLHLHMPGPLVTYLGIFADALTPCALFAIGLGLSIDGVRATIGRSSLLSAVKLVIMPVIVYGLSVSLGLTLSTHCGRDLRCGADGQDCLHSCGRVSL